MTRAELKRELQTRRRTLRRQLPAMRRAAREMGYGDDWKAALEKVKTMYVEPGRQPQAMLELAQEAVKLAFGENFFPAINKGELALLYSVLFLYVACRGNARAR